jgi:hypothetical protein
MRLRFGANIIGKGNEYLLLYLSVSDNIDTVKEDSVPRDSSEIHSHFIISLFGYLLFVIFSLDRPNIE